MTMDNHAARKAAVYEAALQLVARGVSPAAMTIQQLADTAGIGKGTVYGYFSSKEEILQGLAEYCFARENERVCAMFADCTTLAGLEERITGYLQELPETVAAAFDGGLVFSGMNRMLTVTLGQFSLIRMERQTQLLIPSYDYCMPEKACCDQGCGMPENPCEAFSRMQFPVQAFFPESDQQRVCGSCRQGQNRCSCGCGEGERRECGGDRDREEGRQRRDSSGERSGCGDRPRTQALPSPDSSRGRGCGTRQNS